MLSAVIFPGLISFASNIIPKIINNYQHNKNMELELELKRIDLDINHNKSLSKERLADIKATSDANIASLKAKRDVESSLNKYRYKLNSGLTGIKVVDGLSRMVRPMLAYIIIIGYVSFHVCWVYHIASPELTTIYITDSESNYLKYLSSCLDTLLSSVLGFYFGNNLSKYNA